MNAEFRGDDIMTEKKSEMTAVIIGAGPAGLTAAYQLLKETDIKPIILEETDFVGGISRTAVYKGNRIDIGGHRFFSKSSRVNKIWDELMPVQGAPSKDDSKTGIDKYLNRGGPDPEKADRVMLVRNRISRIYYLRNFFDYPITIKFSTFKNMGLKRTMAAGLGYMTSFIRKREEKSLEDFYVNRFGRPLYEMFFEDYTEKLWGVHPSKISPDWGAQRVKELSLSKAVREMLLKTIDKSHENKETSLIDHFKYPKKGPGQLWESMAREIEIMGGIIQFNSRVVEIEHENKQIKQVTVETPDGSRKKFVGNLFFSTMPVKDLVDGMGRQVPDKISRIASGLPYRDFITVGLLMKKLKLKNPTGIKTIGNIVPDCWIYIQERDVKIGRLQIFNNWSPYMPADNEKTVWLGLEYFCHEGDEMWNMDKEEFIGFAIDELSRIDIIEKEDVLDAERIKVKKAYPAYFGTFDEFDAVRKYLDGFQNLYCIGRNGQHRYNNMDHSMLTAIEAVRVIKSGLRDRSSIWNVNSEKEYHEDKKEDVQRGTGLQEENLNNGLMGGQ